MGLPDILKVHFFLIPMMYVLCLVGFCPGILDIWLTKRVAFVDWTGRNHGHGSVYRTARMHRSLREWDADIYADPVSRRVALLNNAYTGCDVTRRLSTPVYSGAGSYSQQHSLKYWPTRGTWHWVGSGGSCQRRADANGSASFVGFGRRASIRLNKRRFSLLIFEYSRPLSLVPPRRFVCAVLLQWWGWSWVIECLLLTTH